VQATMSDVATTEQLPASKAPQTTTRQRISARMKHACSLLAKRGMTVTDAAKAAKLSRTHLSRELSKPHIQVFLAQEMRRTVAIGALRASNRVVELVDASSEHVSLDAAKHVLAIQGIKPTADQAVSVSIDLKAGFVIDLSGQAGTITAKPLIDNDTGEAIDDVQVR
jgi:hypothetical protein